MRLDKLTTKLQEALADTQSLAVGHDNQYIDPVHILFALLNQDDAGARCCNVPASMSLDCRKRWENARSMRRNDQ